MTFTVASVETKGLWLMDLWALYPTFSNSKPQKDCTNPDHVTFVLAGQRSGCLTGSSCLVTVKLNKYEIQYLNFARSDRRVGQISHTSWSSLPLGKKKKKTTNLNHPDWLYNPICYSLSILLGGYKTLSFTKVKEKTKELLIKGEEQINVPFKSSSCQSECASKPTFGLNRNRKW